MGSLAKRFGQLTARSIESESSQIIRTIQSNKIPNSLSQRLDTTLKDSHDMKVFGLGTLSSMSNIDRYARFTHSMYGIYSTMEKELDLAAANANATNSSPVKNFWNRHERILRRSEKLKQDLLDIGRDVKSMEYSPATERYMNAIRGSGTNDREHDGGLLLGHAYTRYLADLMGGSVLATPTRLALGLKSDSPQQYSFDLNIDGELELTRKEYVEKIYFDLNASGDILLGDIDKDDEKGGAILEQVVDEARSAFRHNIEVYSEEPIYMNSVRGLLNIISGWVFKK